MATYGLFLESDRCPDGFELAPDKHGLLHFRPRTERTEPLRLEMQNLENPVVVEFINAREDADRIKFFAKYGSLWPFRLPSTGRIIEMPLFHDDVPKFQERRRKLLAFASGSPVEALQAINEAVEQYGDLKLAPKFDLAGEGGAPRMLLKCDNLGTFMTMEVAMIATSGAKLATCKQCGKIFLTGPLTWRRAHAQYCSDRCRVAAMRVRNKANVATQEG